MDRDYCDVEKESAGNKGHKVVKREKCICSMCNKELDYFDLQENFRFNHHFGYGSKYDLQKIDIVLCCDCMDKVLDKILPLFEKSPLEDYD